MAKAVLGLYAVNFESRILFKNYYSLIILLAFRGVFMIAIRLTILFFFISFVSSCSQEEEASIDSSKSFDKEISSSYERPKPNPEKNVYFGDLHVHTSNSFDAYTFGTLASPSDAYRYAQGEAILHPTTRFS